MYRFIAISYHTNAHQTTQYQTPQPTAHRVKPPDRASSMLIRADKSYHGLHGTNGSLCIGSSKLAALCHGKLLPPCCAVFCVLCCVVCCFFACCVLFFCVLCIVFRCYAVLCVVYVCYVLFFFVCYVLFLCV